MNIQVQVNRNGWPVLCALISLILVILLAFTSTGCGVFEDECEWEYADLIELDNGIQCERWYHACTDMYQSVCP